MHEELISYIKNIIIYRLSVEFRKEIEVEFPLYDFSTDDSDFSKFVSEKQLALPEIIVLLIALLPHVAPGFLSHILSEYHPEGTEFPEFGGVRGSHYRGILPTGETVQYIIAGTDIDKRTLVAKIFEEEHIFYQKSILSLGMVESGEPKLSGKLLLDQEYIDLFLHGYISKPKLGIDFPAERIVSGLNWSDLILSDQTKDQVNDILIWLKHHKTLIEKMDMRYKIKPGYRVLFHGPPGTGKTLTANLLGKQTGRDVYRVDLALVVSKFIGETEKNLSKLFEKAKNKDWILFFDEADGIVGMRTNVRDAHDKYANQEVSYLLQRIESYPGLIVLATNYKSNIDKAFTRRFQAFIEFENPNYKERLALWKKYIPKILMSRKLKLKEIAKSYDLTGSNIVNVVQYACLKLLEEGKEKMDNDCLKMAIEREYLKEGRMM